MVVHVTGANGFIGRHLVLYLMQAGHQVRAAVRSETAASHVPRGAEVLLIRDTNDVGCWTDALSGCDTVVHLIGLAHASARREGRVIDRFRAVNVAITGHVVNACLQSHVHRLIYVSSIKAVGEGGSEPYGETTPCAPEDAYGVSKREAEVLILERAKDAPIEAAIVRPPVVYGPEATGNIARMMRLVATGLPLPIRCIRARRSMVFVGNLVDALRCLSESSARVEGFYHVSDAEDPWTTRELLAEMGRLMGKRVVELPVPVPLLRGVGRLVGMGGEVDRLTRSLTVSASRLREELGWEPPYSRDEALAQTIRWHVDHERDR